MAKPDEIRQKLRRAAMRLLSETGANQVSVSALAKAAGVARGTVYNNMPNPAIRYDELTGEMVDRLTAQLSRALEGRPDPAEKLSLLIRLMLRKAAEDPVWAGFVLRFVMVDQAMKLFWSGLPAQIMEEGRAQGRFAYGGIPLPSVTAHMGGAVLMAMFYIHNRQREWHSQGAETAELALRAVGLPAEEARRAAHCPLPAPPPSA